MKKIITFFLFLSSTYIHSQISAEAQGGKVGFWSALGIDQEINANWISITDIGYGKHSDPNNRLLMKRAGLNVITQDFVHKINSSSWQISLSFGYWKRNTYSDTPPYNMRENPFQFRNEIRPYSKLKYTGNFSKLEYSHTFRTDYRFYFIQNFSNSWPTPFEFRFRIMETLKLPLTANKKNYFILVDEVLSAIDKKQDKHTNVLTENWTEYQFTENRLSAYYKRTFINQKMELDLGIMHQYWREKPGEKNFNTTINFMIDLIVKDPFGEKKKTVLK